MVEKEQNVEGRDNCIGPNSEYIKLISYDGEVFYIKREYVLISETIKAIMNGTDDITMNDDNEIVFPQISSAILKCVCDYLVYVGQIAITGTISEYFHIDPNLAFELVFVSHYLRI